MTNNKIVLTKIVCQHRTELEELERLKDAREHQMFPDEVLTPKDTPARIRFQKYRGLASFRTSAWDPKVSASSVVCVGLGSLTHFSSTV